MTLGYPCCGSLVTNKHKEGCPVAAAQDKIDEMRKRFEEKFKVYPVIGNTAYAPTGEEYVEAISNGTVASDLRNGIPENMRTPYPTADDAIAALTLTLDRYAAAATMLRPIENQFSRQVLYWRMPPEIDKCQEGEHVGKWKTYARLLISAKRPIYPARRSQEEIEFVFPPTPPAK